MIVADDTLAQVRKSDRGAVETILNECYPAVHRMACALTGQAAVAQRVTRAVLAKCIRVMPQWRKGTIVENWFYHHTLLAAREMAANQPPPKRDLLVTAGPAEGPAYVAFVRALRELPRQQTEAFVLNHGEKLNSRLLGVAMDCSTQAAAAHLVAAMQALQSIAGAQFAELTAALEKAYSALTPAEAIVRGTVQKQVSSALWRKRLRRLVRRLLLLVLFAALAYLAWRRQDLLRHWYELLKSHATTKPI